MGRGGDLKCRRDNREMKESGLKKIKSSLKEEQFITLLLSIPLSFLFSLSLSLSWQSV